MSGGKLVAIFSGLQEFFGHAARIERLTLPCTN